MKYTYLFASNKSVFGVGLPEKPFWGVGRPTSSAKGDSQASARFVKIPRAYEAAIVSYVYYITSKRSM